MARAIYRWAAQCAREPFIRKPGVIGIFGVRFFRWPEVLDLMKGGEWDVVDAMMETDLAVLDEIGGGYDKSGIGMDKLCQVLTRREKQFTIVTTNLVPDAWEEAFDRRIASRLFRNATHVDLSDVPDYPTI